MFFFKRKPGQSLVLDTPQGQIVIEALAGDELGIEVPPGIEVSLAPRSERPGSWLPARPGPKQARVA